MQTPALLNQKRPSGEPRLPPSSGSNKAPQHGVSGGHVGILDFNPTKQQRGTPPLPTTVVSEEVQWEVRTFTTIQRLTKPPPLQCQYRPLWRTLTRCSSLSQPRRYQGRPTREPEIPLHPSSDKALPLLECQRRPNREPGLPPLLAVKSNRFPCWKCAKIVY